MGVNEDAAKGKDIGAGDQGLMFGYASNETPEFMPLPIALAHRIINRITDLRQDGTIPWLRPDSKSQVTIEYEGDKPLRVHTVVVSTQHAPGRRAQDDRRCGQERSDPSCSCPPSLTDDSVIYHINPTGKFVVGGPHGDSGSDGTKDHRRYLRRQGPARRRRLQRQRPHQGRSLRRLHGSVCRQEHRRIGPGGAVRDSACVCDRRLRAG